VKGHWTIDELEARVEAALGTCEAPENGQVRAVPDRRTIRYYTTIGLLDRPAEMRGRTALYARRHLLQLVAIKRLQAEGLSLQEVQATLTGKSDKSLASIAKIDPASLPEPIAAEDPAPRSESFWRELPAAAEARSKTREVEELTALRLFDRCTILFDAVRPLDDEDRRALTAASAPLLRELENRGLIRPFDGEES
jgi:DNA-binding transcriptional MerR regulator